MKIMHSKIIVAIQLRFIYEYTFLDSKMFNSEIANIDKPNDQSH